MKITVKQAMMLKGQVLRFSYPAHGYENSCRCMEPRCARIEDVRPQRGNALIIGHDFSKGQKCTFFLNDMEDIGVDEEWPEDRLGFSVVVLDKESSETLAANVDREDADGLAFGFNSQAISQGYGVRAAVALDRDLM